jgi:Zn-dependent peptidase ImmA (M78 family)
LGEKPIPNMIHLLESRGALVLSLAQEVHELDAFSFWSNGRPIVFLNTMKSAERSRMDAAHELLHLLCHREETGKEEEKDANRFAGELLMPRNDLRMQIPRVRGLAELVHVKHRWGVALSALVYRLHELKIASDWQYRTLFVELSKRGYRTLEPNPLPAREGSALLPQVFGALAERGIRPLQIARELAWNRCDLDELIFGLGAALVPVPGDGQHGRTGTRPDLHLVAPDEPSDAH